MIEFQRIKKTYIFDGHIYNALQGVDGKIASGEMVALYGPSGSGKSSLLNVCSLLDENYQGRVIIGDEPITKTSAFAVDVRRKQMGFIFPKFNLVSVQTVFENIEFPLILNRISKAERTQRVLEMIDKVGLSEFVHFKPERLTGKQKQCVAIARAFIHKPVAVIADEPTASLDSDSKADVIELMLKLGHELDTAILVATNDATIAKMCHRTIHMLDGCIVEHVPAVLFKYRKTAEALPWGV
ncbi:ABC transporter ATP-binding protein [Photobacterium sagamiensis]|uniref:ABC transporter ATP-binding protein n=1 Tax=Photobacterium sagamiensis TaxID=2910241 RepID=UPI003D0A7FBE